MDRTLTILDNWNWHEHYLLLRIMVLLEHLMRVWVLLMMHLLGLVMVHGVIKLLSGRHRLLTIEDLLTRRVDCMRLRAAHFLRWDADHGRGLVVFLRCLHTVHQIVDVDRSIRWQWLGCLR